MKTKLKLTTSRKVTVDLNEETATPEIMDKHKMQELLTQWWKISCELGDELPPRILDKIIDAHSEAEDWIDDIHPQATWPKHHGNLPAMIPTRRAKK